MEIVMKKWIPLFCIAFALLACRETEKTKESDALEKIKAAGELVLGLDDSFPPMGFRNTENEIVGFDIDLAKEVASRLGVTLRIQPISWDAKEQELNTGKIDCIWNGMSVDSSRAAAMSLSAPYLQNRMVFVVKDSAIQKVSMLAGKKIAVQNGSTAQKLLEASDAGKSASALIPFDDNLTALMDLEKGGVESVFLDEVVADYLIAAYAKSLRVLAEEGMNEEEYAIGFRKKDLKLRDAVDSVLNTMRTDGTFAEISVKWFGK